MVMLHRRVRALAASLSLASAALAFQPAAVPRALSPRGVHQRRASSPAVQRRSSSAATLLQASTIPPLPSIKNVPPVLGGLRAGFKKLCVVTGASSGLGLDATRVLCDNDDYFVICAVRNPEKMKQAAEEKGISPKKYAILQLDLSDQESVKQFVFDLKAFKSNRPLDALVCNAAVYLPTDPQPAFTRDGFEMTMAANHLGHFTLCNLLLEDMSKAKAARMIIVGSITGNSNTVGGGLVYPRADVGQFEGWQKVIYGGVAGDQVPMVDASKFLGAKAYKDSKVCNMMTVSELHRRYHESTGITFSSLYPGCIAETALFREKRQWFRQLFPVFMKYVTGGYVSQEEAGERLAQVVTDPQCAKSGVYWSWNGGAKRVGVYNRKTGTVVGAGGSGGEIFENEQSDQVTDLERQAKMFDLSSQLVGITWPKL